MQESPDHAARAIDVVKERAQPAELMLDLLAGLNGKIADLDKEIARRAREDDVSRRLMTIPGIGPICATAIAALAPPWQRSRPAPSCFRRANAARQGFVA